MCALAKQNSGITWCTITGCSLVPLSPADFSEVHKRVNKVNVFCNFCLVVEPNQFAALLPLSLVNGILVSPGTSAFCLKPQRVPTFVDLCCGAMGGFSHACLAAGFKASYACDIDQECIDVFIQTFRHAYPPNKINCKDVRHHDFLSQLVGTDLICAGFPCQPHSGLGKQLHGDDPRFLLHHLIDIASFV
jgi:hypothetical protein